ncbi:MAG TPA: hypothetical protein DEH78_24800 [Solibacterales bacterium]|nr:hypothetical protein [Bryobacterales bacterium]
MRPSITIPAAGGDRLYSLLIACRVGRRATGERPFGLDIAVHSHTDARLIARVKLVERADEYRLRNFARVLGYDGRRLWVFGESLYGLEPQTHAVTSVDELTAANPALAGQWVSDAKYYEFDEVETRVRFRSAQGALHALDPQTLEARPVRPREDRRPKDMQEYDALRDRYQDRSDMITASLRPYWRPGVTLGPASWLGLLTSEEVEKLRQQDRSWEVPSQGWRETDVRRFWLFHLRDGFNQWKAPRREIVSMEPAPGAPEEYLEGGVMRKPFSSGPVELADPPGFLVLHRSRLGSGGTWLVTRVDRSGKAIRTVDSRLGRVEQIVPDARYVTFIGALPEPPHLQLNEPRLVTVRTADGARFDGEFQ